ncbi:MAG: GTPase Era [Candidatus Rokubacteria bacterium]|nr:GTPase Era [Candidatus Rokubacteria bacterium]
MSVPPQPSTSSPDHKSGFISIVGRPNVGKSTLLNRLLGHKIAIVSPKPQTTRNRITGIRTLPDAQIVYVDTPGLHPPRGKLGQFMAATALQALEEVDGVVFVAEATEDPAALDETALAPLQKVKAPVLLALNKVDVVPDKRQLLPLLEAYAARHPFRELIPISAADGTGVDRLEAAILGLLAPGPAFYPPDQLTDQPETFFVAETIREKLFLLTRQEVPYATAVRVEELTERQVAGRRKDSSSRGRQARSVRRPIKAGTSARPQAERVTAEMDKANGRGLPGGPSEGAEVPLRLYVRAEIFVEQPSQKAIVIGEGGAMLKRVGEAARRDLEAFFGVPVYLDLWVRVRKHWRRDAAALRELGYRLTS